MYALKEHVDVEFEVKVEKVALPKKKTRRPGTAGMTNKAAPPKGGSSESKKAAPETATRSPSRPEPAPQNQRAEEKEVPGPSFQREIQKEEKRKSPSTGTGTNKPLPNRPRSAANPSKRFNAARAMQLKQELPWNYDLTLADRDILTLEKDAQIASKRAAREHLEKKAGERVATNNSSRVRSVKAMSGTALNGKTKTIFALVHQRQKEALNKAVSRSSRSARAEAAGYGNAPAMELIDKYSINREETGIHSSAWDNSELLAERLDKELRLLPAKVDRLRPMTADDMNRDVSYKNRSALVAGESTMDNAVDDYGRKRVASEARVTRLKEGSLSDMGGY